MTTEERKEIAAQRSREWRANHREQCKERDVARYANNSKEMNEKNRKWYAKNREAVLAQKREYYQLRTEDLRIKAFNRYWQNPEAARSANRTKRVAHKEQYKQMDRNKHLQRTYGITSDEFEKMADSQGGRCAICMKKRKLCVDHDHATGAVRSLLCRQCNSLLGHASESESVLKSAIRYLKRYNVKAAEHEVLPLFANGGAQ